MFTGIIQEVGCVASLEQIGGDVRLSVTAGELVTGLSMGDSIAVNGVCLTVAGKITGGFEADISTETLSLTALGKLEPGVRVNLESALTLNTPLGGHLVSGHIDGVGEIILLEPDARSIRVEVSLPEVLSPYLARKGSIAVDGVSLTINRVSGRIAAINILPHTVASTIFGDYEIGRQVNVEVDIIARYLEQLAGTGALGDGITWQGLRQHGFLKEDGTE